MNKITYGKQTIDEDDINSVIEVLKSDFLTTGPKSKAFEEAIAKYCGSKYCVSVSNGTAALHLASIVLLKKGDKVLTTPNSFLSTANSILYVNAKPIFVDICIDGNIDLDLCEEKLKNDPTIKALYVVHFSGNQVNQEKLKYIKNKYDIKILEDCAHSLGSTDNNIKAGSCTNSEMSIFSFHPVKSITTGEGGAITTNDENYYKQLISLRNHGTSLDPNIGPWHYDMLLLGFNYRLTDISSALGLSQLQKLDNFIKKRKIIAERYDKVFMNVKGISSLYPFKDVSSYHLYILKIDFNLFNLDKKEFFLELRKRNIFIQYHYIPINKQKYYQNLGYGLEETPIMDEYYKKAVSLPIFPNLTSSEQEYVIKCVFEILNIKYEGNLDEL